MAEVEIVMEGEEQETAASGVLYTSLTLDWIRVDVCVDAEEAVEMTVFTLV